MCLLFFILVVGGYCGCGFGYVIFLDVMKGLKEIIVYLLCIFINIGVDKLDYFVIVDVDFCLLIYLKVILYISYG